MISKDNLLERTDRGLAVFKHYLGEHFRLGKNFRNPFYPDKNASCNLYLDRNTGIYKMKDFGNPAYDGDCFTLVALVKKMDCKRDFHAILKAINEDMGLMLEESLLKVPEMKRIKTETPARTEDRAVFNPPELKEFSQKELAFWGRSGINAPVLQLFQVASVQKLSGIGKGGNAFTFRSSEAEPIFAYSVSKTCKYYLPFSKSRFLYGGKMENEYVFGWDQLPLKGEIVFLTGGEKDVMSLHAHGFSAICFNSETATIPKRTIKMLSYRFKHLVLLYDVDKTGLEASLRHQANLKEFEVKRLLLPLNGSKTEKDVTDYFRLGYRSEDLLLSFLKILNLQYENTLAILKPCIIDWDKPPVRPEPLITINEVVIASPSNIVCVSGSEGSGKSNYIGAIIAGALNTFEEEIDTLGTFVEPNFEGKALLIYDTEQTEDQLYKNLKNTVRRAYIDRPPKWFKAFSISNISRKERIKIIIESMDCFYYRFKGIHLVVIDGIADLLTSVNDEAESVLLVEELYRLAGFYKTCIIVVLHLAPNAYKLRGHLGSEIQRKAAGILCVEKNDAGNSVVKAIKVREGNPMDVPNLQFAWDKTLSYHVLVDKQPARSPKLDLQELVDKLFTLNKELAYAELVVKIQNHLNVKERQAKNYIKLLREKNLIHQNTLSKYVKLEAEL